MLKGLPLTYDRDMQEDKEPVFDAVDTLELLLPALAGMISTMTVRVDRLAAAAPVGFSLATEVADWLVRRGVPFRDAHEITGRLVALCAARDCALDEVVRRRPGRGQRAPRPVGARRALGPLGAAPPGPRPARPAPARSPTSSPPPRTSWPAGGSGPPSGSCPAESPTRRGAAGVARRFSPPGAPASAASPPPRRTTRRPPRSAPPRRSRRPGAACSSRTRPMYGHGRASPGCRCSHSSATSRLGAALHPDGRLAAGGAEEGEDPAADLHHLVALPRPVQPGPRLRQAVRQHLLARPSRPPRHPTRRAQSRPSGGVSSVVAVRAESRSKRCRAACALPSPSPYAIACQVSPRLAGQRQQPRLQRVDLGAHVRDEGERGDEVRLVDRLLVGLDARPRRRRGR